MRKVAKEHFKEQSWSAIYTSRNASNSTAHFQFTSIRFSIFTEIIDAVISAN